MADIYSETGVRKVVREEIRAFEPGFRSIVRDEIDKSPVIRSIQDDLNRHEVILEDIDGKLDTVLGMLSGNLQVKGKVADRERRLSKVETTQNMLSSTVALHSKQLKQNRGQA